MGSNLLSNIARSRELIAKLWDLGQEQKPNEMDELLKEFNEIYNSTDHYEVIENYVKSVSNAIGDFTDMNEERRSLHQLSILEEVYNSTKGVLLAEIYSNSLNGVIRNYSFKGNYTEATKFLEKLEIVYNEFQNFQFVIEQYLVSVHNLLIAGGINENLENIEHNLSLLLDLNKKHPTSLFNVFVVDALGYCAAYFGLSNKLERFSELVSNCKKIYYNRTETTGPPLIEQQFPLGDRLLKHDAGYVRTIYNICKYYGVDGQIYEMEKSFEQLLRFFKLPPSFYRLKNLAGEPLGVAFRNVCSVYARKDEYEKLEETIKNFEKLYKKYKSHDYNFVGELANVTELALDYFDKIGNYKTSKKYSKKLKKYSEIIEERRKRPYRTGSTRYKCNSCNAKWVSGPVDYEFANTKEVFASNKHKICPFCEKTEVETQHEERFGIGIDFKKY